MKKTIALFSLFALTLSACNLTSAPTPSLALEQQAATVVAQTLTAIALENLTPLASPTAETPESPLATPSSTEGAPTLQPNITPTASTGTPTATILTVDSNTNCREGPGTAYKVVIVLTTNVNYQMIARTADNKYWIVTEIGKSTTCWVPSDMSNAFGNVSLLPVTTPSAPTSSAGMVQAPTGLAYQYSCTFNGANSNIIVSLKWTDHSENETGFRVYRDGTLVADLPANTTYYTDAFTGDATVVYSYRVSAYNASGEVLGSAISFSCQ